MKKQLTIEATIDVLTGLYNRRYFYDISTKYYDKAKRYNQKISVLMIDIDKFKNVNDTYGHDVGDTVIASTGKILTKRTRNSDVVARYGGEEFIVLLAETEMDRAVELAERIRIDIENNHVKLDNGNSVKITVSIGVTELNHRIDKDIEETIKRSDKALYEAKNKSRNRVSTII